MLERGIAHVRLKSLGARLAGGHVRLNSRFVGGSFVAERVVEHLARGIGVVDVRHLYGVGAVKPEGAIDLVVNLEVWDDQKAYDRLGLISETQDILGVTVPSLTIPVRPGRNLAVILELAAMNNRQKKMGYNAAETLASNVDHAVDNGTF